MRTAIQLMAMAVVVLCFASASHASVIVGFTSTSTTVDPGIAVSDLTRNGSLSPWGGLNNWPSIYNFAFTLTVPAGKQVTITSSEEVVWEHSVSSLTVNASYSGTAGGSLGSGTITLPADNMQTHYALTLTPAAPVTLAPGDYTMTYASSGPNTGGWMGLVAIRLNGEVIPEPATLALLGLGGIGLVTRRARRSLR